MPDRSAAAPAPDEGSETQLARCVPTPRFLEASGDIRAAPAEEGRADNPTDDRDLSALFAFRDSAIGHGSVVTHWGGANQATLARPRAAAAEAAPRGVADAARIFACLARPPPNSVWTYDFIHDRLASGTALKILCVLEEHTRECLAIEVGRWMRLQDVILALSRLMKLYGKPQFIRSDNGAQFTAKAVMKCLRDQNIGPAYIAPGRPWQNGFVESLHRKLRDECLNREWFLDVRQARILIERWRQFYNHQRPHSALDYRTPAEARQQWIDEGNIEQRLTA